MATESKVELLSEGTGPNVRTIKVTSPTAPDAAGNATADTATHQQVVALAKPNSDLVESRDDSILMELRMIRELLTAISVQLD